MRHKWKVERRRLAKGVHIYSEPAAILVWQVGTDVNAAMRAEQKVRCLQSEAVSHQLCRIAHIDLTRAVRIARVARAMRPAEPAHAGAHSEIREIAACLEDIIEIAAMAPAFETCHVGASAAEAGTRARYAKALIPANSPYMISATNNPMGYVTYQ